MNNELNDNKIIKIRKTIFDNKTIIKIEESELNAIMNQTIEVEKKRIIFQKIISNSYLEDKTSQEYASSLYTYLLNKEGSYDDAEVEFITYYTIYLNYKKIKYDEEGEIRHGYEQVEMPSVEIDSYVAKSETAKAAFANDTVYISYENSIRAFQEGDKNSLFEYIQALSHEMVHYRQDYEASHGLLTESSFKSIIEKAIRLQSYDDNAHNYRFRETEVEAQLESMEYAVELARRYFPKYIEFQEQMLLRRENYLLEEALSFQYDDENIIALRDFYDIGLLSIAVSNGLEINQIKIDLLKQYPQLQAFFNKNREIRSEEELLKGYRISKAYYNPIANIYEQFLVYIYHKEPSLMNTSLPPNVLKIKRDFIISQLKKEQDYLNEIEYMIHYSEHTIKRISTRWGLKVQEIINQRKERIKSYKQFLESTSDYSMEEDIQNIIELEISSYEKILDKIKISVDINDIQDKEIIEDNNKKGIK